MPPKKKANKKPKDSEISSEDTEEEKNVTSEKEETLTSEEIILDSESELGECEVEQIIVDDNDHFNTDQTSEIQVEVPSNLVYGDKRRTNPRLTKYEAVRILGERIKQLTMGAKPLIKSTQDISHEDIALEELKLNMIPFKLKRPMPNNSVEVWDLKELKKDHLGLY